MTETFYRTGNHKVNYSSFGGVIQLSDFYTNYTNGKDFYTNYTNGNIAERIVSDWNFDKWCKYNTLQSTKITNWRKKK